MAGLTPTTPQPTAITVHQQSRVLEVGFADGQAFRIPFELMRVYSPSAEVQGHGPGQEVLQTKINLAALGNMVPHLHWHVIERFDWDSHFPQAVWGARQREVEGEGGALARLALDLPALDAAVAAALSAT